MTNATPRLRLVLTCEHGGNRIPAEYKALFRGAARVLASHRGWDPGALALARALARRLRTPLHAITWSRLLVEANRAPTNPRIWSRYTRALPAAPKALILERYWRPHRDAVLAAVQRGAARGQRVLHVAVHSFTPALDGRVRNADIGLLYDFARRAEVALMRRWATIIASLDPALRVRRNYPYRGHTDGLPTWLRRRLPAAHYVGVELELNQAVLAGPRQRRVTDVVAASLQRLLEQ